MEREVMVSPQTLEAIQVGQRDSRIVPAMPMLSKIGHPYTVEDALLELLCVQSRNSAHAKPFVMNDLHASGVSVGQAIVLHAGR